MEDDSDVPPLEDCSQAFLDTRWGFATGDTAGCQSNQEEEDSVSDAGGGGGVDKTIIKEEVSFGAFKKGFLDSGKKKQKRKEEDAIKEIGASGSKESGLPEMLRLDPPAGGNQQQERVSAWMQNHPDMLKALMSPNFEWLLDGLQKDPMRTLELMVTMPELQKLFGAIMQEILLEDNAHQEEAAMQLDPDPEVKAVLEQPGVVEALQDPRVKSLLDKLRAGDQSGIDLVMRTADADLKAKIQILLQHRLLAFS